MLQGYRQPDTSIDTLSSDISGLITTSKAEFAQNPWNTGLQMRLKALLDLQAILQSQALPHDQIALIREQVAQLSQASQAAKGPTLPVHVPSPIPVEEAQIPTQQPSLSSLLGPGALAALLARQGATLNTPTPPLQQANPVRSPDVQHAQKSQGSTTIQPPMTTPDPNSLLERLRAAGMLPTVPVTCTPPGPLNALIGNVPPGFPPAPPSLFSALSDRRFPMNDTNSDVVLKQASLKM